MMAPNVSSAILVRLTPEDREELRQFSSLTGVSMSEIVRQAVRAWLDDPARTEDLRRVAAAIDEQLGDP